MDIESIANKVNAGRTVQDKKDEKTKEQWIEDKQAELQGLWALLDIQTENAWSSPEALEKQLRAQATLSNMSASNVLLIESQFEGATEVHTFDDWKVVNPEIIIEKGSKGIGILVPVQVEKDGETRTFFNVKKVFDVSQTNDEAVRPTKVVTDTMIQALLRASRAEVVVTDKLPAYFSARYNPTTKQLGIRKDIKPDNVIGDLSRSVVAAYRHRRDKRPDSYLNAMTAAILAYRIDPSVKVKAEDLALCIEHNTPNEPKVLREMLSEAGSDAKEIFALYAAHHKEICKENRAKDTER